MSHPENNSDSEVAEDSPAPDVMARILEPRVRSNAKNNPRAAKIAAIETLPAAPIPSVPESLPDALPDAEKVAISQSLDELREMVASLHETQTTRDRAFDLLYEELSGYKNDFYLERLKPTLRALLFLLDSIEGFEREIDDYDARGAALSSEVVRANLVHFRVQLTDVLTLSEMTPIEPNGDSFDPKTQRAVEVVKVEPDQNNSVQRQIRGGWKLGDKMLRPADVVVGKSG